MTPAQPALLVLLPATVLATTLAPTAALAQQDVETGAVATLGGAGAAHAHDNGSLTANPAAMGLSRRYAMSVVGGFWDGRDFRAGVVAVDSLTTPGIAMGVAYQHYRSTAPLALDELPGWTTAGREIPSNRAFNGMTVGLALPVADNRFSVGLSGQLQIVNHAILGTRTSGDLDVGLAGRPTPEWSLGVAVRNVLPPFIVTDESIGVTAGTRYAWNDWTSVAVDVDVPFTAVDGLPVSVRGGAEIGQDLRQLGIGYRYEGPTAEHWLSFGAGLWSDTDVESDASNLVGLHYAAQLPFHDKGDFVDQLVGVRHTLTITVMPKPSDEDRDRKR